MLIQSHRDLDVYKRAFSLTMELFAVAKQLPTKETYNASDQMLRSSRSVCANLAEAWRKRRYKGSFVSKLSDAEAEAAETQVWIEIIEACGYIETEVAERMWTKYEELLGSLVGMQAHADKWCRVATPATE
jgi:four helix bundle protein